MSINFLQILIPAGASILGVGLGVLLTWLIMRKKSIKAVQEVENRLTDELEGVRGELAETGNKLESEIDRAGRLREEKKRLKQKLVDADEKLRELDDLRRNLEDEESRRNSLEEKINELSGQLAERDTQLEEKEKSLAAIKEEMEERLQKMEENSQELQQLNDELQQTNNDYAAKIESMEKEIAVYKEAEITAEQTTGKPEAGDELQGVIDKYARKIAEEIVKS